MLVVLPVCSSSIVAGRVHVLREVSLHEEDPKAVKPFNFVAPFHQRSSTK